MKNFCISLLLSTHVFSSLSTSSQDMMQYPEQLHNRVMAKLGKTAGSSGTLGYWADWSPWSSCSRSCGTGVKTQSRDCQQKHKRTRKRINVESNSSKCIGIHKRHQLCNMHSCKKDSSDFRMEQCARYNKTPFNRKYYQWEDYVDDPESCTLNCRPVGLQFYATLNQSVVDGTPCGSMHQYPSGRPDKFCIEGTCINLGCDGLLGSRRALDSCGICGGDNSTCRLISGVYSKTHLPFGYNLIATIPEGTRNVSFLHQKPTNNFIALRDQSGIYSLNGPSGMSPSGIFFSSGTKFTYVRPTSLLGDQIYAQGPTKRPLDVMVYYEDISPGIKYEYRIPVQLPDIYREQSSSHGRSYRVTTLEEPSEGNHYLSNNALFRNPGSSSALMNPALPKNSPFLSDDPVRQNNKASLMHPSNFIHPYLKKNLVAKSSPARKNPFLSKTHTLQGASNIQTSIRNPKSRSPNLIDPRLQKTKNFHNFVYELSPPKQLSSPSQKSNNPRISVPAKNLATNQIYSSLNSIPTNGRLSNKISPKYSSQMRRGSLNDERGSNSISAYNYESANKNKDKIDSRSNKTRKDKPGKRFIWVEQGFTSCSRPCGGGTRTNRYICVRKKSKMKEFPVEFCAHLDLPNERTFKCNLQPCSPQWEPSEWSPCSVSCGFGVRLRHIYCSRRISSSQTISVPDYLCEDLPKPKISKVCQKSSCEGPPIWETASWSSCSSSCGLGTRRRNVTCATVHGLLRDDNCPQGRPPDEEICDLGSCATDTWLFADWDQRCQGPCDEGFQTRIVHCSGNSLENKSQKSCSRSSQPISKRSCDNRYKCAGSWFTGPWGECNADCGPGQQRRSIVCVIWIKGRYKVAKDDSYCKASGEKPTDTRLCNAECKLQWFTSNWSQCSKTCDGGVQRREIKCLDEFLLPSLECSRATKPDSRQSCNIQPCDNKVLIIGRSDNQADLPLSNDSADDSSIFPSGSCVDRMKNCKLVFKARLCKLRYYYKLCCKSCSQ